LTVAFQVTALLENVEDVSYLWYVDNSQVAETSSTSYTHVFANSGPYSAHVLVSTSAGDTEKVPACTVEVKVGKNPDESSNNNPDIPDQVKKPEPSEDNQDRIDAGPTDPVDSDTGCDGDCPGTVPQPEPEPVPDQEINDPEPPTQPDSGDGATDTVAPPTTPEPPADPDPADDEPPFNPEPPPSDDDVDFGPPAP
jgi:hypothetical protein